MKERASKRDRRPTSGLYGGLLTALSLGLLLALIAPAMAQTGASSGPTRIKFLRGAISVQVRGQLTKREDAAASYVLKAEAGGHLVVNIIALTPGFATSGGVTSPSGKGEGQHGGIIFNGDLKETGDYVIQVGRNLMAAERPDGEFILEIVVLPAYLKETSSSAKNSLDQATLDRVIPARLTIFSEEKRESVGDTFKVLASRFPPIQSSNFFDDARPTALNPAR